MENQLVRFLSNFWCGFFTHKLRTLHTGKGSFGEIFLASDDIHRAVTSDSAKYVAKIEPHSNGPLFVEIHCLLNTAKKTGK